MNTPLRTSIGQSSMEFRMRVSAGDYSPIDSLWTSVRGRRCDASWSANWWAICEAEDGLPEGAYIKAGTMIIIRAVCWSERGLSRQAFVAATTMSIQA